MKRQAMVAILLAALLLVVGCSTKAADPVPPKEPAPVVQPTPTPTPAQGFALDREKTITEVNAQVDTWATGTLQLGATRWMVSSIAFLAPNYVLVDYEDGHVARRSLLQVEESGAHYRLTPVLGGESDPRIPIQWNWRRGS